MSVMWRDSPPLTSTLLPLLPASPHSVLCDLHSLSDRPRTCCQSCLLTCPLVVESLFRCRGVWSGFLLHPSCFSVLQAAVHAGKPVLSWEWGAYSDISQRFSSCFGVIQGLVSNMWNSFTEVKCSWVSKWSTKTLLQVSLLQQTLFYDNVDRSR